MKKILNVLSFALVIIMSSLFISCDQNPIPKEGTKVESTSPQGLAYKRLAGDLKGDCRTGGCTCYIDGIQSSCALTFACLDAGFCRLIASK